MTRCQARLLDWLPDHVEGAGESPKRVESADAQHFLYAVALLGLGARQTGLDRAGHLAALPLHARELPHDLASERFDTTTAIAERLRSLATKPVTITRARRRTHMATSSVAPLMNILNFVPVLVFLLPLLAQSPDTLLLYACLYRLAQLEGSSSVDAARERAAVEIFLVGRFRPLVTADPTSGGPWVWEMIESLRPAVQRGARASSEPLERRD